MRFRSFAVDLATPLDTANGPIDRREGFLVDVDVTAIEDGKDGEAVAGERIPALGIGEATPLSGWTESLSACESALHEARTRAETEAFVDVTAGVDPTETPAARHGLALALADATARGDDRSLSAHLAADHGLPAPAAVVPVNATIGDGSQAATVREAEQAVAEGFGCLKLKVGVRDLDDDIERLRAVREHVGDGVVLRADANGAWDRETAARALDRLEPLELAYVEQPIPADDLAGAAALRENTGVRIALDESLANHTLGAVVDAGAADVVVLKPMALGGPDRALATALRARAAGVEPVVTTTIDAVVARTAAVHVAAAIPDVAPCGLATGPLLAEDLAADPCPVDAGQLPVPEGVGLAGGAFDGLR